MNREKIKETINFLGSLASITGVSLLWLQNFLPGYNVLFAIPILAVAALLAIGLLAIAWLLLSMGYLWLQKPPYSEHQVTLNIAYCGVAGAATVFLLTYIGTWIYIGTAVAVRDLAKL